MTVLRKKRAFTLIELLAAMAILAIIILFIGRIFAQSTKTWKFGTRQVNADIAARAFLGFVGNRIESAVADSQLPFYITHNGLTTYTNAWNSEIGFVAFSQYNRAPRPSHSSDTNKFYRTAEEYAFFVDPMQTAANKSKDRKDIANLFRIELYNRQSTKAITCYEDYGTVDHWFNGAYPFGLGSTSSGPVLDNVSNFRIWVRTPDNSSTVRDYDSSDYGGQLPLYVDLYLELLSEKDAILAKTFADANQNGALSDLINKKAKRYSRRIYFHNRNGYTGNR